MLSLVNFPHRSDSPLFVRRSGRFVTSGGDRASVSGRVYQPRATYGPYFRLKAGRGKAEFAVEGRQPFTIRIPFESAVARIVQFTAGGCD